MASLQLLYSNSFEGKGRKRSHTLTSFNASITYKGIYLSQIAVYVTKTSLDRILNAKAITETESFFVQRIPYLTTHCIESSLQVEDTGWRLALHTASP
jgi:hypothetical protein